MSFSKDRCLNTRDSDGDSVSSTGRSGISSSVVDAHYKHQSHSLQHGIQQQSGGSFNYKSSDAAAVSDAQLYSGVAYAAVASSRGRSNERHVSRLSLQQRRVNGDGPRLEQGLDRNGIPEPDLGTTESELTEGGTSGTDDVDEGDYGEPTDIEEEQTDEQTMTDDDEDDDCPQTDGGNLTETDEMTTDDGTLEDRGSSRNVIRGDGCAIYRLTASETETAEETDSEVDNAEPSDNTRDTAGNLAAACNSNTLSGLTTAASFPNSEFSGPKFATANFGSTETTRAYSTNGIATLSSSPSGRIVSVSPQVGVPVNVSTRPLADDGYSGSYQHPRTYRTVVQQQQRSSLVASPSLGPNPTSLINQTVNRTGFQQSNNAVEPVLGVMSTSSLSTVSYSSPGGPVIHRSVSPMPKNTQPMSNMQPVTSMQTVRNGQSVTNMPPSPNMQPVTNAQLVTIMPPTGTKQPIVTIQPSVNMRGEANMYGDNARTQPSSSSSIIPSHQGSDFLNNSLIYRPSNAMPFSSYPAGTVTYYRPPGSIGRTSVVTSDAESPIHSAMPATVVAANDGSMPIPQRAANLQLSQRPHHQRAGSIVSSTSCVSRGVVASTSVVPPSNVATQLLSDGYSSQTPPAIYTTAVRGVSNSGSVGNRSVATHPPPLVCPSLAVPATHFIKQDGQVSASAPYITSSRSPSRPDVHACPTPSYFGATSSIGQGSLIEAQHTDYHKTSGGLSSHEKAGSRRHQKHPLENKKNKCSCSC